MNKNKENVSLVNIWLHFGFHSGPPLPPPAGGAVMLSAAQLQSLIAACTGLKIRGPYCGNVVLHCDPHIASNVVLFVYTAINVGESWFLTSQAGLGDFVMGLFWVFVYSLVMF